MKRFNLPFCQPGDLKEDPNGAFRLSSDFDALEAEAQALREEVEEWAQRCAEAQVQRDAYQQERDEALRTRVVVVPGRIPSNGPKEERYLTGWNACLDELARLHGKTVSEGLLRRISDLFPADMGDDGSGRAGWFPHVRETVAELRALLSEKEGGKP